MRIARRDLLRLGAAAALSVAATACQEAPRGGTASPSGAESSTPVRRRLSAPASPVLRDTRPFPGRPAPGDLYYGASLPDSRSLAAWERALAAPLALHRSYFTPDHNEVEQLVQRCRDDLLHGRLPHVSMKPLGTWREVASGARDDWLRSMLAPLAALGRPVFFTMHHEPENDAGPAGMQPADFVAMQRHLIELAAAQAPQVTVVPVLQHWTFEPLRPTIDPREWIVPEAAVFGLDVYNPWSPTNSKPWRTFGSLVDEVLPWTGSAALAIGEYGCREDPADPGSVGRWLEDAATYAREHGIVSMSYFNSAANSPDGSFELGGLAQTAFGDLLTASWVARPVRRGA